MVPRSNWTDLNVWQCIHGESIPVMPLYSAKPLPVIERTGPSSARRDHDVGFPVEDEDERDEQHREGCCPAGHARGGRGKT